MTKAISLILALLVAAPASAQTLDRGAVAVIGFNFDNPDALAFVALDDLPAGTELTFTDNGWRADGSFRDNEGAFTYTADEPVAAGTVIKPEVSGPAFSAGGDQILVYQGAASDPYFVYALNSEGDGWQDDATSSNTSALPSDLENGRTAVALGEVDNATYTGPTSGTREELLAAISDPPNWTGDDGARQTLPSGPFTVSSSGDNTPPTAPGLIAPSDGASVTIEGSPGNTLQARWNAAGDADGDRLTYRWQLAATRAFNTTLVDERTGADTTFAYSYARANALLADLDVQPGETATLYHRAAASDGDTTTTGDAFALTLERSTLDAIDIGEARSRANGTLVNVEGVVTRTEGDFTRIQDATGGLVIRQTAGAPDPAFKDSVANGAIRPGTRVRVTGALSEFRFLKQMNSGDAADDLRSFRILSQGNELPEPQVVTLQDLNQNGEEYESELIRVENLSLETPDAKYQAATEYQNLSDATLSDGSVSLYIPNATDTEIEGATVLNDFMFTGVLGQYNFRDNPNAGYQLLPVAAGDVRASGAGGATRLRFNAAGGYVAESADSASVPVVIANPGEQETSVAVERTGGTAAAGQDVDAFETQTLTFQDGQSTRAVSLRLRDDERSEGDETITLSLSGASGGNEAKLGTPATFTLTTIDDEERAILPDQEGAPLREALADTYEASTLGYDVARDRLFGDLFNRQDTVRGFYTNAPVRIDPSADPSEDAFEKGFNTEHAWPRSKGADDEPALSNLHILFPTRETANGARGNLPYGDILDEETETWFYLNQSQSTIPEDNIDRYSESTASRFEPRESVKGDVARAAFYFNAVYPDRADNAFLDQQRSVLREWHQQDPPSASEKRRNARIAAYQGGAINPFLTDPSLVRRAFFTELAADDPARPTAFVLHGNAPNPARTSTMLRFDLPATAKVSLSVYDVMGRKVLSKPARTVSAGANRTITLDAAATLPAGVYVYRLTARTATRTFRGSSTLTVVR